MRKYEEVIEYLYAQLPVFMKQGTSAYKKDLNRTLELCEALGNPQDKIKTIHVGGTNGKGSSSHLIAAVLQESGYKVGLYTSPHLVDFTERIRVGGQPVEKQWVVDFVQANLALIERVKPSFFELTVAMCLDYFQQKNVDIAVIEVGLGGKFDSTNIIHPEVSLITNIGMDHSDILGNTLVEIASEKAGIIKKDAVVVVSEKQEEVKQVFIDTAREQGAKLYFGSDFYQASFKENLREGDPNIYIKSRYEREKTGNYHFELLGSYQTRNIPGVLKTLDCLYEKGFNITPQSVKEGLARVSKITGLQGRWQKIDDFPQVICDTGHNVDGIKQIVSQLNKTPYRKLRMVIGMMGDKDVDAILALLPPLADYYFCTPDNARAISAADLQAKAARLKLRGSWYPTVVEAIQAARKDSTYSDLVFVGGSNFVVADALRDYSGQ